MLTETELKEYCNRLNLSESARNVIRTVRNSDPARRVKSGPANVACRYASRKMGMTIQAESHKNELPALVKWDRDKVTHEIYDQPPAVKLHYRNKNGVRVTHMSTPDFFLLQEEFAGWIENKTEEWLLAYATDGGERFIRDGSGSWRCPPGEKYAASLGLGFKVQSSAEINWIEVRNIEFLSDYLDERCPPANEEKVARIREAMTGQAWVTLKQLLDEGCEGDAIYKMIVDGMLYFDLDNQLLAEPERAYVFRDQFAAEAYRIYHESQKLPAIAPIRPVRQEPGSLLVWDGKPWRILNFGENDVFMEDEEHVIGSLSIAAFDQMVKEGVITGLPEATDAGRETAEQLIKSASPDDFEHALYRHRNLLCEKSGDAQPSASTRAMRKWRSKYRKSEQAYGSGFIGLLPSIHLRGNRRRKIDRQVIAIMNKVIDERYRKEGGWSKVACWGEASNLCIENGLAPPSERTFRAEIKRIPGNQLVEEREGAKAAYPESEFFWRLDRTTPRHGERPFEIGHIDHTELDMQFVGARRGEKLHKAWLTIMIDAHTRIVLASVLMFDPPSYRSCMAVIRECIKRHGRVPQYIVVDQGSEFEGVYFECLLARLGSHKKSRPASKPRFGSVIERFFGMSNEAFVHNLVGSNKALQNPRQMSPSHDPRKLAVWTLPAFRDAFEGFLDRVYSCMEHPALGMSPKEAMAVGMLHSGVRRHMLIPYSSDFVIMCLPATKKGTAMVASGRGVKISYIYYWTPEFRDPGYHGANVPVRYDPFDVSTAYVWLKDHWARCRSEYAAEFQGRSEKEIGVATQEVRARQLRGGSRRAVNSRMIAAYLREASVTEEGLRQQSRSQDTGDLSAFPQEKVLLLETDQDKSSQNSWDNLNIKIFGEF